MTDADGHPDVDEISALAEGLLPPSEAASVRQHMQDCPECSDTLAALEEISGLLGSAPVPSLMPLDVAERIDAALAAEALLASEKSQSATETTEDAALRHSEATENHPRGSSLRPSKRRGKGVAHVSRETSTASAGPSERRRPPSGPGRQPRRRLRGRRRSATLGAVFTVIVIGIGAVVLQSMTGSSSGRPGSATSKHPSATGQVFSADGLQGQVDSLLKKHPEPTVAETVTGSSTPKPSLEVGPPDTPKGPDGDTGAETKTANPLEEPGATQPIPECVKQGIGRNDPPIAAERGVYEGKEAYLVVLPHATDATMVSAYVVDAACTRRSTPLAGTVLLTHSYPRG